MPGAPGGGGRCASVRGGEGALGVHEVQLELGLKQSASCRSRQT